MEIPPGTVIVPTQEGARWHQFTYDYSSLLIPERSRKRIYAGTSIVQNMNLGVADLRPEDDWIWLVGDDHSFDPEILLRLLRRCYERDLDTLVPLCSRRGPPFQIVHFNVELGDGLFGAIQLDDLPTDGEPFEIVASGCAGMVIRRRVLDELGPPWFRNTNPEHLNEEFDFCIRAREAGFQINLDPATSIGHIGSFTATPEFRDGRWGLKFEFSRQGELFFPGGMTFNEFGQIEPEQTVAKAI